MMRYRRWSNNDSYLGPYITYARRQEPWYGVVLDSGDEDMPGCHVRFYLGRYTVLVGLPQIIQPWRRKVIARSWDEATVARMGRNWYWDVYEREYGFQLTPGGHLSIFYGRQTDDSLTDQRKGFSLPWMQWHLHRDSLFGRYGEHVFSHHHDVIKKGVTRYAEWRVKQDACPKRTFWFADYDGERIRAETRIEEHELRFGTGWFAWLSLFRTARVRRSLSISFSAEVGREKGSWKGGTTGHGIEMLPGELHEGAFKRYCAEHGLTFFYEIAEDAIHA